MSIAHSKRRKTIRKFKTKFGKKWRNHFLEHTAAIRRASDGNLIGTLESLTFPLLAGVPSAGPVPAVSP